MRQRSLASAASRRDLADGQGDGQDGGQNSDQGVDRVWGEDLRSGEEFGALGVAEPIVPARR